MTTRFLNTDMCVQENRTRDDCVRMAKLIGPACYFRCFPFTVNERAAMCRTAALVTYKNAQTPVFQQVCFAVFLRFS